MRTWPQPVTDRTIHLVGDTHFGSAEFSTRKQEIVRDDLMRSTVPRVKHRLQLGDLTNTATELQDTNALAWFNSLDSDELRKIQNLYVVGNHDIWGVRTGDQAAQAWGLTSKDYVFDLGHANLIVLGPDAIHPGNLTGCLYDAKALTFLDTALTQAGNKQCIIAAHAPLKGTVGAGGPSTDYKSTDQYFYAATDTNYLTDAGIRNVLNAHKNAIAWISGHTHSPLYSVDLVKSENVGSRKVVAINTSCLAYTGISKDWNDRLATMYLTIKDDRIDVRFRDHAAHQWTVAGPNNKQVWSAIFT